MKKTLLIAALLASVMFCIPTHAESTTAIDQYELQLTINGDIRDNDISLSSTTEHTHIKEFTSWPDNKVEVYVEADDGYYFNMTQASSVVLSGANYLKASKQNKSRTLYLRLSKATGGYWVDDENGRRFKLPDGSYWDTEGWFIPEKAYFYVSDNGYILRDCQTPDGYRVDENGVWTDTVESGGATVDNNESADVSNQTYDNVIDDTLIFLYNGEVAETPCKIYYRDYRRGAYTTVKYESVYIQEWNGENANMVIDYSVPKTGSYNSTYFGYYVYVNGVESAFLGGNGGTLNLLFSQTSTTVSIPTYQIVPGDLVEIYIAE